MADTEFEEFHCNNYFEKLSVQQHPFTHPYTLVHDVNLDDDSPLEGPEAKGAPRAGPRRPLATSSSEEDLPASVFSKPAQNRNEKTDRKDKEDFGSSHPNHHHPERKRRKLPQIPTQKKPFLSLAEELCETLYPEMVIGEKEKGMTSQVHPRSFLMMKCLEEQDSSPTEHDHDSGISTVHSPDGPKSSSPSSNMFHDSMTPSSMTSSMSLPFTHHQLELLEATHRALHKFLPRHHDEMEIEIGDPIYVQKEAEDLWCEGVNLRTGRQGIFPSAYAVDLEYEEFDSGSAGPKVKRERFLIGYLGSLETLCHKGNAVLNQAVKKMTSSQQKPQSCILEVSDQGLRMNDKTKPSQKSKQLPCHDYFYALKNVTFCAFHPEDHRYMCFITKHPQLQRFACHLFLATESTRPVVESVGRALQRFYEKYIETAYPVEEIYIEDEF
ncbi:unnamed protein product [Bemisia tabaci]|uniref:JNK-interacting protein 1 n=1 Tax=Bemisia tabaci TaxID=7038 RepID=A0A9P0A417_BEMTA|nr:unnamed protein product [Bemisia tabaci]